MTLRRGRCAATLGRPKWGTTTVFAVAVAVSFASTGVATAAATPKGQQAQAAAGARAKVKHIVTTRWGGRQLKHGRFQHTRYHRGVVIGSQPVQTTYDDPYGSSGKLAYARGRWYSPWTPAPFGLTQLVASYTAKTPHGTYLEISARGHSTGGDTSSWDSLGRWASHDNRFHRMSLGLQRDDLASVHVDTLVTSAGVRFDRWQLRISLFRRSGTAKTPTVTSAAGVASRLPANSPTSSPRGGRRSLAVPAYSQQIHRGEYPRWDGGGEAWCSPTSTSMVLGYWHRLPTPKQYSWVRTSYAQPWVDYAARFTFAWGYDGTGDWPFNTAYAGRFGLDAFVTRLRSLREAGLFIRAGIPLVATISFGPGGLDGAPITSTSGHLVVIRGFTAAGNVIVNDPAAASARSVRRVYQRDQFENAWTDANGGVVYVIHPRRVSLPDPAGHSNW